MPRPKKSLLPAQLARKATEIYHALIEIRDRIEDLDLTIYRSILGDEPEIAYLLKHALARNSVKNLTGGTLATSLACCPRGSVPEIVPKRFKPSPGSRHYVITFEPGRPPWITVYQSPGHNRLFDSTLQSFIITHDSISEDEFRKKAMTEEKKIDRQRKRREMRKELALPPKGSGGYAPSLGRNHPAVGTIRTGRKVVDIKLHPSGLEEYVFEKKSTAPPVKEPRTRG